MALQTPGPRAVVALTIGALILILLLGTSACAATPPPTPTPTAIVLSTRLTAVAMGVLALDNGCLRINHDALAWPPEFTVTVEGGTVKVHDGLTGDQVTWHIGEPVFLGGGEVPYAALTEPVRARLSPNCSGPYWLVGGIGTPGVFQPTLDAMRTAAASSPTPTLQPTAIAAPPDTPTPLPAAPSATPTAEAERTPTLNPLAHKNALGGFPFPAGTTWVYSRVQYQQVIGDPTTLITATNLITTTVIGSEVITPSVAVQYKETASLVTAAPGCEDNSSNFDAAFWYLLVGHQIFLSCEQPQSPEPPKVEGKGGEQTHELVYDFPLVVGKSWCPSEPPPAYNPKCAAMGRRTVVKQESDTTPVGAFDECYEITEDYNSGGVTECFCNGIGVVARKFDHSGTRFGFQDTLIHFSTLPMP
jgi:hypothetical protein